MRLPRSLFAALTATAVLVTVGGVADASSHHGKPVQPKAGVWEAAPKGVDSYSLGGWTLGKVNGHLHMTAHPDFGGVYYPNADRCGGTLNPALSKPDYRLGSKGTFRIKDLEQNFTKQGKPLVQHVVWTGRFTHRKAVQGKISIWLTKASSRGGDAKPQVVCRDMHRSWTGGFTSSPTRIG
jgi:hypothetical protein